MANFFDYFNGSKYYRKKRAYEKEFFESAQKVIKAYNLKVPLYNETYTRPLTDKEATQLKQDREALRNTIKQVDGYGTTSQVVFYDDSAFSLLADNYVRITKLGLIHFTNILADLKARSETHYATDLIDPAVIAMIVMSYLLGIALSAVPFMQALGWSTQLAAYSGLVTAVMSMLYYIKKLGDDNALKALEYEVISQQVASGYASYSNYYMANKKLQAGDSLLFNGYANFANGQNYVAETAGSESFRPTHAYDPTNNFVPLHKTKNATLENVDERTQGRSHYHLAGNEGYMDKISPYPLAKIKELENDMEYKLNFLKQHNQRLLEGYSKLAQYTGSNEDYHAGDWIQAIYNADYRTYKDNYYDYIEPKDFIAQLKRYNYALRFKGEFYSRSKEERKWIKVSKKVDITDIEITEPPKDETPTDDPISIYNDCVYSVFYNEKLQDGSLEAFYDEYEDFDTQNPLWKTYEAKFLESLDIEKYWQLLNALKAIGENRVESWVSKAIEAGYLESVAHNYFIAKGEKLAMSDYPLDEAKRLKVAPPYIIYVTHRKKLYPYIVMPYAIFAKNSNLKADEHTIGYMTYDDDGSPTGWYPYIYWRNEQEKLQVENQYINSHSLQYEYQAFDYKVVIDRALNQYIDYKDFAGKEFTQLSFKILCDRQVK